MEPPKKTTFSPEFLNCIYTMSISAKIWKITFPKEFFNEIWLKLGNHEYINIAEIKFG